MNATPVVQALYVMVIALVVITLLTSAISSIAVALGRFGKYWRTGLPVLLAALFLGYGVFASATTPIAFAVAMGGFAVGYGIATFILAPKWLRFVPVGGVLILLIAGESNALQPGIKAAVFLLCSGMMVATTVKMRSTRDEEAEVR